MTEQTIESIFYDRETAIKEHRKMWNWIADTAEREKRIVTKEEYLMTCDYEQYCIVNNCFCCEYDEQFDDNSAIACNHCPLVWYEGQEENMKENKDYTYCMNHKSPYRIYESIFSDDIEEEIPIELFIKATREIANLKEVKL